MASTWAQSVSISPTTRLEDAIKDVKLSVSAGLQRLSHYQKFVPPTPIALNIKDRPLHPDNANDSDWAIIYDNALENGGYSALSGAVLERAQSHSKDSNISPRSNYLIMSEQNMLAFMMILASMYPGFVRGLIRGDIFYQYAPHDDLRRAFDLNHSLEKIPGNYLQGLVQGNVIFAPPSSPGSTFTQAGDRVDNPHKGKGVTFAQLHGAFEFAERYLPSSASKDMTVVALVDAAYQPKGKDADYPNGKHKYMRGPYMGKKNMQQGNEHKFGAWLKELREIYIDRIAVMKRKNPNDPLLNIPMRLCLREIGWGQDVQARANNHEDHQASNNLFTFYQALMKTLYGNVQPGEDRLRVQRLATNFLNRGDKIDDAELDAKIADVCLTMIAQSEWFNAGLNPQLGGGAGVQRDPLDDRLDWIRAQAERTYTKDESRFKRNVVQDREKVAEMRRVESYSEQTLLTIEAKQEKELQACRQLWNTIQKELKLLEDVVLAHITEQLVEAGLSGVNQPEAFVPRTFFGSGLGVDLEEDGNEDDQGGSDKEEEEPDDEDMDMQEANDRLNEGIEKRKKAIAVLDEEEDIMRPPESSSDEDAAPGDEDEDMEDEGW